MSFKTVVSIYGSITAVAGFVGMGWGGMFMSSFGLPPDVSFSGTSMIRLAGAGFFMAGILLLSLRPLRDAAIQRRVILALTAANVLGALIVWAQQNAIWDTRLGLALTVWLWLAAASFGLFALLNRNTRTA